MESFRVQSLEFKPGVCALPTPGRTKFDSEQGYGSRTRSADSALASEISQRNYKLTIDTYGVAA
ncbi:MAG: hypothetical protein C5B55_10170 [Blastocatellia bacterium]|nr:MAG: hypothetical protein C5B55_10170 [Blastocatellia bacterium]